MYAVPDGLVENLLPPPGSFLCQFVRYAATQTDAPLIFHFATALSLLSTVMPPSLHYWGPGSETHPNLYTMVIGGSGVARKTASMRIGRKLLANAVPDRLGKTPLSYGALVDGLAARPEQIIFDEDMARFLKESKGAGFLSGLKQGYLTAYDCGPLDLHGRTHGSSEVANPRLNLYSAVNMTELSEHLDVGDLSSGFLSRFVFFSGQRTRLLSRQDIRPQPEAENFLRFALKALLDLSPRVRVGFSPEAEQLLDTWEASLDGHLRNCEDPQESSLTARIPEFARKIAILQAVDEHVSHLSTDADPLACHGIELSVSVEAAQRGMRAAQLASICVLDVHRNLYFSSDMRERGRVIEALPLGQLTRLGLITQRAKLLKGQVMRILDTLEEERVVVKQVTQAGMCWMRPDPMATPPPVIPPPPVIFVDEFN